MSILSTMQRLVALRPQTFWVVRHERSSEEGHLENLTSIYGPYTGALFDPSMTAPGGPNTDIEDVRTDSGWRLNFAPLPDIVLVDSELERDSVLFTDPYSGGYDHARFRILKVTPLGGAVAPGGFRAILEKYT